MPAGTTELARSISEVRIIVPDRDRLFPYDDRPGPPRGQHVRASSSKFCRFVIGPTPTKVETLRARMIDINMNKKQKVDS